MEGTLQHATAALVAGLQATGTGGNLGPATGAWGCGKRYALPTSPHPRLRLRTNIQRGVTLTFRLVQKIGQVMFMRVGAHTVLVTNPRDMHAFIHDLKKYPFTIIIAVNTLYRALLDAPELAKVDTRALKVTSAGGMAVQRAVAERWKQRTGVTIIEGYGLTEASPVVI